MGLNFYPRPARADLDPPSDLITESLADDYGDNGEMQHWADTHTTMLYVDKQLDEVDVKIKGLFGYGNN